MASYIRDALIQGEQVMYEGHISLWSLAPLIVIGFLLLPAVGIGLIFWLVAFIRYKTTELAITNKRIIVKLGFISRQTIEMNVSRVESIQVHQTVLGRLFDYGSLLISGAGDPQAAIPGISQPLAFRRAFMEAQDKTLATRAV